MQHFFRTLTLAALLTGASLDAWAGKAIKVGPEFRVSAQTSGNQEFPTVAALTDGGFVVVWQAYRTSGIDSGSYGIYGQRYETNGTPVGGEFLVNTYTEGGQYRPSVARLGDGGFVVVWQSDVQEGSTNIGIYGQRYQANGAAVRGEFHVNSHTDGPQLDPSVAGLTGGGFVVAWESMFPDGSGRDIHAQRYKPSGRKAGTEFRVNTSIPMNQNAPSVAELSDGGFVITWTSFNQGSPGWGTYCQRYAENGTVSGEEFRVSSGIHASVAARGNEFAAASERAGEVFAAVYDASGAGGGEGSRVNTTTAKDQLDPAVSWLDDGGLVVAWSSYLQDTQSSWGVYLQQFGVQNGQLYRIGRETRANKTRVGDQRNPSIAGLADGGYVVVWQTERGIYGQRFSAP